LTQKYQKVKTAVKLSQKPTLHSLQFRNSLVPAEKQMPGLAQTVEIAAARSAGFMAQFYQGHFSTCFMGLSD
jgi:hypothetical protein